MEVALSVPIWAMVAFGSVAYPAVAVAFGQLLNRLSGGKLSGTTTTMASFFWPVTTAGALAAFPVWLVMWFASNYKESLANLLRRGRVMPSSVQQPSPAVQEQAQVPQTFGVGSVLEVIVDRPEEYNQVRRGAKGIVYKALPDRVYAHWTNPDGLSHDGYIYPRNLRRVA